LPTAGKLPDGSTQRQKRSCNRVKRQQLTKQRANQGLISDHLLALGPIKGFVSGALQRQQCYSFVAPQQLHC